MKAEVVDLICNQIDNTTTYFRGQTITDEQFTQVLKSVEELLDTVTPCVLKGEKSKWFS